VPAPVADETTSSDDSKKDSTFLLNSSDALVSIYLNNVDSNASVVDSSNTNEIVNNSEPLAIGQGVIISDIGLILVDSVLLNDQDSYKVVLDKTDFNVSILKKFSNGFTILKISAITDKPADAIKTTDTATKTQ
jgi:hypothetical protein